MCYVLRHTKNVGDNCEMAVELNAIKSNCKLLEEGPPALYFGIDQLVQAENVEAVALKELPNEVLNLNVRKDDVAILKANGVGFDENNEQLPENVPFNENPWALKLYEGWGFTCICPRQK